MGLVRLDLDTGAAAGALRASRIEVVPRLSLNLQIGDTISKL